MPGPVSRDELIAAIRQRIIDETEVPDTPVSSDSYGFLSSTPEAPYPVAAPPVAPAAPRSPTRQPAPIVSGNGSLVMMPDDPLEGGMSGAEMQSFQPAPPEPIQPVPPAPVVASPVSGPDDGSGGASSGLPMASGQRGNYGDFGFETPNLGAVDQGAADDEQTYSVAQEGSAAPYQPNSRIAALSALYARGTQRVAPEGVGKAGETWRTQSPSALPGDRPRALPNRPTPGVDDPSPWQMTAAPRPGESKTDQYSRIMSENAARRAPSATEPSRHDQAKRAYEEDQDAALLDQRAVMQGAQDNADAQARDESLIHRGLAAQEAALAADEAARRAAIDKHIGDITDTLERRERQLNTNPVSQYWNDRGFMGRLAVAFGAMGQSLNGGQNPALEMANREIDAEVARHSAMVADVGKVLAAKRSILGDALLKFRSPEAMDHAVRALLAGKIESLNRRNAAHAKSLELQSGSQQLADGLALERSEAARKALEAEHTAAWQWHPAATVGEVGGLPGIARLAKDMALTPAEHRQAAIEWAKGGEAGLAGYIEKLGGIGGETMIEPLPAERGERAAITEARDMEVRLPPELGGGIGYAPKGYANKVRDGMVGISMLQNTKDRLEKMRSSHSNFSVTDRAQVEQDVNIAVGILSQASGAGAPTGQERAEFFRSISAGLNDFTKNSGQLLKSFERIIQQFGESYKSQLSKDPAGKIPFKTQPRIVR